MKKGQKLTERKDWFVENYLLGSKFNTEYLSSNLKKGFFNILKEPTKGKQKLTNNKRKVELCAILSTMALTGARITEVLRLMFMDIKLEKDEDETRWVVFFMPNIKGKKGSKKQIKKIPVMIKKDSKNLFLYEMLDMWYMLVKKEIATAIETGVMTEQDVYDVQLFPNFTRTVVHQYSTKFCRINPHGFRKVYTQHLVVEKNMPIKIAQKLLGHRNLDNLDFYINLKTTDIKESLKKINYEDD